MYGTITRYGPTFQKGSTMYATSTMWSYNPNSAETVLVWAIPCSLATTRGITICFLFLRVLRCFSSPGKLPFQGNTTSWYWVAPFGDPWITGYYAPPHGFSQPIASFIASESQGIRHTPLVTFRLLCLARWTDLSVRLGLSNNTSKNGCPGWACLHQHLAEPKWACPLSPGRVTAGTVENIGVEPMTSCLQSRRSSQLS